MMKMLTLTNVLTLTVHSENLRVRSYKDTKLLCPYWKTLYITDSVRLVQWNSIHLMGIINNFF